MEIKEGHSPSFPSFFYGGAMAQCRAYRQLIDALWVLEYTVPGDGCNEIRGLVGEQKQAIILKHYRDDRLYGEFKKKGSQTFLLHEGENRIVFKIELLDPDTGKTLEKYPVRNKANVFSYK